MKIRLVKITRRKSGDEARQERIVESEACTIGRSTDSTVVVNDLSTPLRHSSFVMKQGGLYLEREDATELVVDGTIVESAVAEPGQVIRIGTLVIKVLEATADEDLAVELRELGSRGDELVELARRTKIGVGGGWRSRRLLSWLLVILFVGAFLLLPLWVTKDQSIWSSGPISSTHSFIAHDCGACHTPFTKVRDDSCLSCHSDIGAHFAPTVKLSEAGERRCVDCHLEHGGSAGLAKIGEERCASCHSDIAGIHPKPGVENASDFSEAHPEFTLSIPVSGDVTGMKTVKWSRQLREESGVRFSHFRHVAEPVLEPGGGSRHLRCDECHGVDSVGRYMKPISFEDHCQSCHSLAFDAALPATEALHGNPEALRVQLRGLYSERALKGEVQAEDAPGIVRWMRPGQSIEKSEAKIVYGWVEEQVAKAENGLIGENGECARCHDVRPGAATDRGFDIESVSVSDVWMPGSIFTHRTHRSFPCRDCHAAAAVYGGGADPEDSRPDWSIEGAGAYALWSEDELWTQFNMSPSKNSHDVLLPGIAECRTCHGGAKASQPLLASECALCHPFHRDAHGVMQAAGSQVSSRPEPRSD